MYRRSATTSHLLVSAVNGTIRAHEKTTGRRAWDISITDLPHRSVVRLVIAGDHVIGFGMQSRAKGGFFAGNEVHGVLFVLDYATGRASWTARVPGPIFSPTLLVDAPYVFLANGATVSAYSLDDGHLLWSDGEIGEVWTSRGVPFANPIALATPETSSQGDGF